MGQSSFERQELTKRIAAPRLPYSEANARYALPDFWFILTTYVLSETGLSPSPVGLVLNEAGGGVGADKMA